MPTNWSYLSVEPGSGSDREAVLRAVEADAYFDHEATHDGELVIVGMQGRSRAREFLFEVGDHVERATLLWEIDEGFHRWGGYFERRDGDLEEVDEVWTHGRALTADVLALEHGTHGPV